MNRNVFLILIWIQIPLIIYSQNKPEYFKTIPNVSENAPAWIQLMYSQDPNVFEVDRLKYNFYQKNTYQKNIHTQNYKYWRKVVSQYLNNKGYIRPLNKQEEDKYYQILKDKLAKKKSSRNNNGWNSLGPLETYKIGTLTPISWQANVYSIDQSLSNPDILYAGTESGGVYKTIDRGITWNLVTANEVFVSGLTAIQIHPSNPNNVLVSGNNRIYQTLDGGVTWTEIFYLNGVGHELKFNPRNSDTIYCAYSRGLLRSINGGSTWNTVHSEETWDIEFSPSNPDTIYIIKANILAKRAEVFRSDDEGGTWNLKNTGWYTPNSLVDADMAGGKLAISASSPDMIYACLIGASKAGDDGWIGVYRSDNKGDLWINPSGQDGGPYGSINGHSMWNIAAYGGGYHQGFYNFDMEVSPSSPGTLWIGTIRLTESTDSGRTFQSIGGANSVRLPDVHADIQAIEVNGNEVWIANDGGIQYSNDNLMTQESRKYGISAADFWGFGTGWNEDVLFGGKYHNGNSAYYQTYGTGNYHIVGGVEEATGYVHPIESRKVYYRKHYASSETDVRLIPDILGGNVKYFPSLPLIANESYWESYRSGLYFDPRYAEHIFIGKDSIIWKSKNRGVTFSALHRFSGGLVLEMAISRANPDVIYVVYQPSGGYWNSCEIHKTIDGGNTWSQINSPPSNNNFRLEITLNPSDANEIWVACNAGANGQKIYSSNNGGNTWINRTTNILDGERTRDIYYQGGTNNIVYVATNNGVYYWSAPINNWVLYNTDLPLILKPLELRPFYKDAKIRLATSGRGIYEEYLADTNFLPVSQPITYTDTILCHRDTVQFDCYSILKHKNATWQWTISPTPLYVSSLTARNPKVVFGNNGSYTVTLQVSDENGNTSTKTIPNMVTVASACELDSIPSMALNVSSNMDYLEFNNTDFNNLTHFTFSAWIKPTGGQEGFAGIISNGEWCAHCTTNTIGLIYDYWGTRLWYRLPGANNWAGNSGLVIPSDQWSYVAMVVEPTRVILYLNDKVYTSNVSLTPVDIQNIFIGHGHYSKSFKGNIDEVTIWKRALTRDEIRHLRHLTKHNLVGVDSDLIGYLQFNNIPNGLNILDNGGQLGVGNLKGNATLVPSTAPVGHGISQKLVVNAGGSYNYSNVGVEFTFPSTNLTPNGDVFITRLDLLPDSIPNNNSNLEYYWIINNYGLNKNFAVLDRIRFSPKSKSPSNIVTNNPSKIKLFSRPENEHLNNWNSTCKSNNISQVGNGYFEFNANCNLNSFSQFFITSDAPSIQILPIDISNFNVTKVPNQKALLSWNVQEDSNLSYYEVEHSLNGIHFIPIGKQIALGQEQYQFIHTGLGNQYNYYRIAMVNKKGTKHYSVIRVIHINKDNSIKLYPNPIIGRQELNVFINSERGRLKVYEPSGKLVRDIILLEKKNTLKLNLLTGVYFYVLECKNQIASGKIVVNSNID